MTGRTIIAAGQYDDANMYLISTDGTTNQIDLYNGEIKSQLISWGGAEITSACCYMGIFALVTLESHLYIVEDFKMIDIKLDGYFLNSIAFLDRENLIGAGNKGSLYRIDLTNSSVTEEKLNAHGVSKGGRDFIGSTLIDQGALFFGKKRLLIKVFSDSIRDIGGTFNGDEFYFSAVMKDNDIWVSALRGPKAALVKYSSDGNHVYDAPTESQRAPVLLMIDSNLLVGDQKIFTGKPGGWAMLHDFGENTLIKMIVLPSKPRIVFCIGYTGKIDQIPI